MLIADSTFSFRPITRGFGMSVHHEKSVSKCWLRILLVWAKLTNAQRILLIEFHKGNTQPLIDHINVLRNKQKLMGNMIGGSLKDWCSKMIEHNNNILNILDYLQRDEFSSQIRSIYSVIHSGDNIEFRSMACKQGINPKKDTSIGR